MIHTIVDPKFFMFKSRLNLPLFVVTHCFRFRNDCLADFFREERAVHLDLSAATHHELTCNFTAFVRHVSRVAGSKYENN